MASDRHPDLRHDDGVFTDALRLSRVGLSLGFRAIIDKIKSDWAENVSTLGFPAHNDGTRPCYDCSVTTDGMQSCRGVTIANQPFRVNGDMDYFEACDRCEIRIQLTPAIQTLLLQPHMLQYDKRDQGSRGRALQRDLPGVGHGLLKGDRLEPS